MRNVTRKTLLLTITLLFNGCAVIHFENGTVTPSPHQKEFLSLETFSFGMLGTDELDLLDPSSSVRYRKWYHHAIFQIAELSNPMETSQVCAGLEWNQVTTEVTPFDAFAGLLDNAILFNAASAGLDLWSPWSIEYSCR